MKSIAPSSTAPGGRAGKLVLSLYCCERPSGASTALAANGVIGTASVAGGAVPIDENVSQLDSLFLSTLGTMGAPLPQNKYTCVIPTIASKDSFRTCIGM